MNSNIGMIKYFSLITCFFCLLQVTSAQPYNNEWIDYNKTYYKFKIAKTGLYRINQPVLEAIGLGSVPAEHFQLWRNGNEVPVYTSVTTGALPIAGYIEFWGEQNDGKPDRILYKNPASQLSDKYSLQTDTAVYFLTIHTTVNNLRFTDVVNDVANNTLPAEPYFIHSYRMDFKNQINRGTARYYPSEYVYSSTYDKGEFWSSSEIYKNTPLTISTGSLFVANSGPTAQLSVAIAGNSIVVGSRNVKVNVNGNEVISQNLASMDARAMENNAIPLSLVNGSTNNFSIINNSTNDNDRVVAGCLKLAYPRQFNFDNASSFEFSLPPNLNGNYVEISNFNWGSGELPVLYDVTNRTKYTAVITGGILKFRLTGSTDTRRCILVSEVASNINAINLLQQKNFINYVSNGNQGDYLIITNKLLQSGSGDAIDQYKQYRSSIAGGGYNAKVYDIEELVDQFAFGIKKHPLSIKNFLRYARQSFSIMPKAAFLIGKGMTYVDYRTHESNEYIERLNLVPTFGWPASDVLLSSNNYDPVSATPIGRISVVNQQELLDYLDKVKQYELEQINSVQTLENKAWMKQMVHAVGANDPGLNQDLSNRQKNYELIIEDTLHGANVHSFNNTTSGSGPSDVNAVLTKVLTNGTSVLNYFGHSSSTSLSFNLDDPSVFKKYPFFIINGCNAGNYFSADVLRFSTISSLAEKYVLAKNGGTIGFLGSTHFGVVPFLDTYNRGLYASMKDQGYNQPISKNIVDAQLYTINSKFLDSTTRYLHAEQMVLNGDPAIKINAHEKPDFAIEDAQLIIHPSFISVAETQFDVKLFIYNIGKATGDSVLINIKRKNPDASEEVVFHKKIKAVRYIDSISLTLPINPIQHKGENKLIVSVDDDNHYNELSELNNTLTKSFFIYEDELRPVYPYNYSIVNEVTIKLAASTANPMAGMKQYVMEIDTTALFNSPLKQTSTKTSKGGVIEFDANISFADNTVYYWRVALEETGEKRWALSSFLYQQGIEGGAAQNHFYQHAQSNLKNIRLDSASRTYLFTRPQQKLTIKNAVWPYGGDDAISYSVSYNDESYPTIRGLCYRPTNLTFNILDSLSLKAMFNTETNNPGQYGSLICNSGSNANGREYDFAFATSNATDRKNAMDFMDDIVPNGAYVVVRSISMEPFGYHFIDEWKNDTINYGSGNSLYHRLKNLGFSDIDSFYKPRAFVFVYQKGTNNQFTPVWRFSEGHLDPMELEVFINTTDTIGTILSPKFGPASKWKQLTWEGNITDIHDEVNLKIIGYKSTGAIDTLYSLNATQTAFDLSAIDEKVYTYLQLKLTAKDSKNLTPYQLKNWKLLFDPIPEGALAPNYLFVQKDTFETGEPLQFQLAFKNISDVNFSDSVTVKLQVTDKNNAVTSISLPKLKKLAAGDTAIVSTTIDTKNLVGNNVVYVDVNPDNVQPEQYHFNNFLYKNLYVKSDNHNPLLDVTFDGMHILNNDIVSAKPFIQIKLKDEARYLLLDDTSLVNVTLFYNDPNTSQRIQKKFAYGTDTLRFNNSQPGTTENVATIDFKPHLLQDGNYELQVKAKDKSGNASGNTDYKVAFKVFNKPMISDMFNYPNPFTTSTAFVFTVTGNEVPQNLRIQILTITGKIVKEITKEELGSLRIGRNITEYKWDGTDQYGQKLANGVYLYRVITNLNGNSLDKFNIIDANGDKVNTDQYFNRGYGKMYLMR